MPEKYFTRAKIVAALQALGDKLTSRGVHGQVFIVGGAATALAYASRRVTKACVLIDFAPPAHA